MEIIPIVAIVLVLFALIVMFVVLAALPSPKKPIHPYSGAIAKDFSPTQVFMEQGGEHGIAIHERAHQFCLLRPDHPLPQIHHCSDLLASKLMKNGTPLEQSIRTAPAQLVTEMKALTNEWDQFGQPTLKTPNPANQKLDVCLFTKDTTNPFHVVNFLDMEAKPGGLIYNKAFTAAQYWHGLMSELIQMADEQAKSMPETYQAHEETRKPAPDPQSSPAEELIKLATLLDKKLITQEEFDAQKQKILTASLEPVRD